MPVQTTASRVQLTANGTSSVFPFSFNVADPTTIQVWETVAGVTTQLASTAFSVSLTSGADGGNVTLVGIPAAGTLVTIVRTVPQTQTTTMANQSSFYPAALVAGFDNLERQIQQTADLASRSIHAPVVEVPGSSFELPSAAVRAGKLVGFDPTTGALELYLPSGLPAGNTVQTVNGKSPVAGAITLAPSDIGAIPASAEGAAGGVATLDSGGKVPLSELPYSAGANITISTGGQIAAASAPVSSVNGQTGSVTLAASDVGAIPASAEGAAGGVATLGTSGKVPLGQLPYSAGTNITIDPSGVISAAGGDVYTYPSPLTCYGFANTMWTAGVEVANGPLVIRATVIGAYSDSMRVWVTPAGSLPSGWTRIVAKLVWLGFSGTSVLAGVCARESSSGNAFVSEYIPYLPLHWHGNVHVDNTSQSYIASANENIMPVTTIWLDIKNLGGGQYSGGFSYDNEGWHDLPAFTPSPAMTPDQAGFFLNGYSGSAGTEYGVVVEYWSVS